MQIFDAAGYADQCDKLEALRETASNKKNVPLICDASWNFGRRAQGNVIV